MKDDLDFQFTHHGGGILSVKTLNNGFYTKHQSVIAALLLFGFENESLKCDTELKCALLQAGRNSWKDVPGLARFTILC